MSVNSYRMMPFLRPRAEEGCGELRPIPSPYLSALQRPQGRECLPLPCILVQADLARRADPAPPPHEHHATGHIAPDGSSSLRAHTMACGHACEISALSLYRPG